VEVKAGEEIIAQGDSSQVIYFLESGQVTAQLHSPDHPPMRLETMQCGRIFGELGVYFNQPRAATVIADEDCILYKLSREDLATIENKEPVVAAALHRIVLQLMSERVAQLTRSLDALQY
jgi:SulP family sulfate permease